MVRQQKVLQNEKNRVIEGPVQLSGSKPLSCSFALETNEAEHKAELMFSVITLIIIMCVVGGRAAAEEQ